jgi:uroporphyrinogen III methyltransferase/synthase
MGASVIEFPTIRITDLPNPDALRTVAAGVASYDWVVFTSVNGVERFWSALRTAGADARIFRGVRVCAIGPATGAALHGKGIRPDLVPSEFVAEATVQALASSSDLRRCRILLPRAEIARAALPDGLRAHGAVVDEVAAYRTERDGGEADEVRKRLMAGEIDLITFTASSTVRNFVDLIGADIAGAEVASIGPITSRTARELGLPVHVEAAEYTIPGLTDAIVTHYTQLQG